MAMNTENKGFFSRFRKKEDAGRKPSRFFAALGLAGMLFAVTLPGCAIDDQAVNYTSWIFFADDWDSVTVTEDEWKFVGAQGGTNGLIYPVNPIMFVVVDSNQLSTFLAPVPGAEVTLYFGGSGIVSMELYDREWSWLASSPDGLYHAIADDRGTVAAFPIAALPNCPVDGNFPPEDFTMFGSITLAAYTASNHRIWTAPFSIECRA